MKTSVILFSLICVLAGVANAVQNFGSVGKGHGVVVPKEDSDPCPPSVLFLNFDGSAENGYCWQYGGIVPPYYGAFAECYDGTGTICGIQLHLTGIGNPCNTLDAYVWGDQQGVPGNVLGMTTGLNPCPVATWPSISTHDIAITGVAVSGAYWIGYWSDNSAQGCGYFVAADTDGFGGCPMTNIAPGIGYPTGWNNASTIWGPTQSLGIGAWLGSGPPPNPTVNTTWGRVKQSNQKPKK